jgi:hypothetical protein
VLAAGRPFVAVLTCKCPAALLNRSIDAFVAVFGSLGAAAVSLFFLQDASVTNNPKKNVFVLNMALFINSGFLMAQNYNPVIPGLSPNCNNCITVGRQWNYLPNFVSLTKAPYE